MGRNPNRTMPAGRLLLRAMAEILEFGRATRAVCSQRMDKLRHAELTEGLQSIRNPEGKSTQFLSLLIQKPIQDVVFGTSNLNNWVHESCVRLCDVWQEDALVARQHGQVSSQPLGLML